MDTNGYNVGIMLPILIHKISKVVIKKQTVPKSVVSILEEIPKECCSPGYK